MRLCALVGSFLLLLLCSGITSVQANASTRVTITLPTNGEIRVEAELSSPSRSWSFRNAYAGVLGMAERVVDFRATGASGQATQVKKSATGEFRSELDATRITYSVKLAEPRGTDVPYVSWLAADRGFLMLLDLLPQDIQNVSAKFVLPAGWTIESANSLGAEGRYDVRDPENAVFIAGRSLRKASNNVEDMILETVLSGSWPFNEREALKPATKVLKKYLQLTGFKLPQKSVLMIAPTPVSFGNSQWKAETRGSTVVLLIDPRKFDLWKARLAIIFSHEMLHLWVPNALKLQGDYDWFFEGFTLYMALLTAQELRATDFKETLNTLANVYDVYLSRSDDLSLIEASETRWTNPLNSVYIKGMLVAFLYDLKIRQESGGRAKLEDRYRELFSGRVTANTTGNEVIITLLDSAPGMDGFAKSYVEGRTSLELEKVLPAYGLLLDTSGKKSQLKVSRVLNDEQKLLLRSLGYRN